MLASHFSQTSQEEDAFMLFHMLDASHEGHIQADEFLNGCLRLDGPAKAIDLAAFMEESRKVRGWDDRGLIGDILTMLVVNIHQISWLLVHIC